MSNRVSARALRDLNTLFRLGAVGNRTDRQLLDRVLDPPDDPTADAAFAALVQRHGPMVLRVCQSILGNFHDAQDAFQATFLILARKAPSIHNRDSLASWLYGVAYRVASCAKADAARRRKHERRRAAMTAASSPSPSRSDDAVPDDLGPILHEEIHRLPDRCREAVVLCDLEGLSQEQAAARLGCPVGTVKSRLSRGRDRLRRRLIQRGITPTAGLLGAALASQPAAGSAVVVPSALLESTTRAALGVVAGRAATAGLVSTSVATLVEKGITAMLLSKLTFLTSVVVAIVPITTVLALVAYPTSTDVQAEDESKAVQVAAVTDANDDEMPDPRAILREAIETARQIEQEPNRAILLSELAPFLARAGDPEEADRVADSIENEFFRRRALERIEQLHEDMTSRGTFERFLNLAERIARRGDRETAQRLVEKALKRATDQPFEVFVLEPAARVKIALDDHAGARELLRKAARLADDDEIFPMMWVSLRIEKLGQIAVALAELGDREGFEDAVERASPHVFVELVRAGHLARSAQGLASLGEDAEAKSLLIQAVNIMNEANLDWSHEEHFLAAQVRQRPKEEHESYNVAAASYVFEQLAIAYLKLGDRLAARKTFLQALRARDLRNRRLVLYAQARAGDIPGALHAADAMYDDGAKMQGLERIAIVQAEQGDYPGAVTTAQTITNEGIRSTALARVAEIQAVSGDLPGAIETLKETLPLIDRGGDVASITRVQTKLGFAQDALQWINEQEFPHKRAWGLLGVAMAILDQENFKEWTDSD